MKAFAIWLAIVAVIFGGYALITTMLRDTRQVFVFVDSSLQMKDVWSEVPRELDRIDDREYTEFTLAHGQRQTRTVVSTGSSELTLVGVPPFAPCSFDGIDQYPEAQDADERILITTTDNACSEQVAALTDWTIIELAP